MTLQKWSVRLMMSLALTGGHWVADSFGVEVIPSVYACNGPGYGMSSGGGC